MNEKRKKRKETSISWSPDKILYLAGEDKTKCNRVWVRKTKLMRKNLKN